MYVRVAIILCCPQQNASNVENQSRFSWSCDAVVPLLTRLTAYDLQCLWLEREECGNSAACVNSVLLFIVVYKEEECVTNNSTRNTDKHITFCTPITPIDKDKYLELYLNSIFHILSCMEDFKLTIYFH